jgi:hypothetical protein
VGEKITNLQVLICFVEIGSGDIMFMRRLVRSCEGALFFLLGLSKAFLRFVDGLQINHDISV